MNLFSLESHELKLDEETLTEAREELARHAREQQSEVWGHFPAFESAEAYPAAALLAAALNPVFPRESLAFLRYAPGAVATELGGLHVDVDAGAGLKRSAGAAKTDARQEVERVIVNLHEAPREIRYVPLTAETLRARGIDVPLDHYRPLTLPADVPVGSITIPARSGGRVYALRFFSSVVPHVGVNGPQGHFLATYGAWKPYP